MTVKYYRIGTIRDKELQLARDSGVEFVAVHGSDEYVGMLNGVPTYTITHIEDKEAFNAGLERAAVICENIELQSHEIRFTTKSNWVEIIKLDVAAAIRKEKTSNRYPLLSFGDNGYGRMCMLIEVLKERWMKD